MNKRFGENFVARVKAKTNLQKRSMELPLPENWIQERRHLSLILKRNDTNTMKKTNTITSRVLKNLLWNSRRMKDTAELEKLEETIKKARTEEKPMTESLKNLLQEEYLFMSRMKGTKIQRVFLMTRPVSEFPEQQYLLLSTRRTSNITEGSLVSNENSDLKRLRCMVSGVELPEHCYKEIGKITDYSEFPIFAKERALVVVRLILHMDIVQTSCRTEADVVFSKGILIMLVDPSCRIYRNGMELRKGENIENEEDFGFSIVLNKNIDIENSFAEKGSMELSQFAILFEQSRKEMERKIRTTQNQLGLILAMITGLKEIELKNMEMKITNNENMTKNAMIHLQDSYQYGFEADLVICAFLTILLVITFVLKFCVKV